MITLNNFSLYEPEYKAFNAFYLQTADGLDWFYHRTRFQPDTLKICYDESGVIRMYSYQADILFPLGLSVTEVEPDKVPEGLNNHGDWLFLGGRIVPNRTALAKAAENTRLRRIREASQLMVPLNTAMQLSDITEAETQRLKDLLAYVRKLEVLDVSASPDTPIPDLPQ